jgi:hypothetical protein
LKVLKEKGHPIIQQLLRDFSGAQAPDDANLVVTFAPGRARDLPLFLSWLPIFSRTYYAGRHHVLAHPRLAPDVGEAEEGERGTIRLRMVSPVWPVAAEIDDRRPAAFWPSGYPSRMLLFSLSWSSGIVE